MFTAKLSNQIIWIICCFFFLNYVWIMRLKKIRWGYVQWPITPVLHLNPGLFCLHATFSLFLYLFCPAHRPWSIRRNGNETFHPTFPPLYSTDGCMSALKHSRQRVKTGNPLAWIPALHRANRAPDNPHSTERKPDSDAEQQENTHSHTHTTRKNTESPQNRTTTKKTLCNLCVCLTVKPVTFCTENNYSYKIKDLATVDTPFISVNAWLNAQRQDEFHPACLLRFVINLCLNMMLFQKRNVFFFLI